MSSSLTWNVAVVVLIGVYLKNCEGKTLPTETWGAILAFVLALTAISLLEDISKKLDRKAP